MASYPNSIYTPRERENRSGVVYDPAKKSVWFKEDADAIENEIIAIENELGLLPKNSSSNVCERIKGFRSLYDAYDDVVIVKGNKVGIGNSWPLALLDIVPSLSTDIIFRTKSLQSTALLGNELVSNGNFSTVPDTSWTWGTGWTHDTTNLEADHTTGNTAALTQSISVTNGQTYQVTFTIKNRTAGSVTVDVNGVYIYNYGSLNTFDTNGTYSRSLVANITGSATLRITPTSDFNGSIDDISIKQITNVSQPNFSLVDDTGTVMAELRGKSFLSNIGFGVGALRSNTTGSNNSAMGYGALYTNTTGYQNTAIGYYALCANTTGFNNSAMGNGALRSNTTGSNNSAIGSYALYSNTTGFNNSAIGYAALYSNTTGSNNSAMGYGALYTNTSGNYNSTLGYYSLFSNTSGSYNSGIGYGALRSNTTGSNNSAMGYGALYTNTTGYQNTAIGVNAGRYIADGSTANQTSNNSVYIGYGAKALADGDTNEIVIGASSTGVGSNSVVLGNDSITKTILKGNVGIGTMSPNYNCHINGTLGFAPGSSVTPANNGDVVIEATSNTTLKIKLKGSDGVVRSVSLTLS